MAIKTRSGRPRKGEEEARRDQLLDHAMQLFAEHGYGNLSLETIAREAHVSLRTIYRHFGGKADLFGAVVHRVSDEFVAGLPLEKIRSRPMEEVLVDFGRIFLGRIGRPECARLRALILAEAQRFPELAAEFYRNGPERTLRRLSQFFAMQQEAGRVIEADSRFLAGQFISALRGEHFQRQQLGLEQPFAETEIDAWVKQVVRHFLYGCLKSEGAR
ncbi:TetR/AcrR family transcriptional regulator [Methylohalobius crimeensis]|uniref:TetR/AcrR family transcriptional regulator n=1 Tax=Methylohalobius crimeensis TaxID=244365 RepID=UPI0003B6AAF1|nr:TetR/AcrR family transcriptional regulator [Methylohalobius crimeensis]